MFHGGSFSGVNFCYFWMPLAVVDFEEDNGADSVSECLILGMSFLVL